MRRFVFPLSIVCVLTLSLSAAAQDKKPEQPAKPGDKPVAKPADKAGDKPAAKPGDKPAEAAGEDMMAALMKYAAPGEHHGHLKALAGKWDIAGKFRMAPDAPWDESKSTSDMEWILGERFLTQKVKGEPMPGMPAAFEGFGVLGYDNLKQKYTSQWMDNMGTMVMHSEGTCEAGGKVITYVGDYDDPMSGSKKTAKSVYRLKSADQFTFEMWDKAPDGKDFMMMELSYSRRK